MKNLLIFIAILFVSLLCSCNPVTTKPEKHIVIKCCGGLNLSSFVEHELVKCGVMYGGNAFKRSLVERNNLQRNNIVRCAKQAISQGRSYLVQYNFAMLPDLEESTFVIFEPQEKGIIVTYSSDGETNWSASVKSCSHLKILNNAYSEKRNCNPDPKLDVKLGIPEKAI